MLRLFGRAARPRLANSLVTFIPSAGFGSSACVHKRKKQKPLWTVIDDSFDKIWPSEETIARDLQLQEEEDGKSLRKVERARTLEEAEEMRVEKTEKRRLTELEKVRKLEDKQRLKELKKGRRLMEAEEKRRGKELEEEKWLEELRSRSEEVTSLTIVEARKRLYALEARTPHDQLLRDEMPAWWSSTTPAIKAQLERCEQLHRREPATYSPSKTRLILAEYSDLKELFEAIYYPKQRLGPDDVTESRYAVYLQVADMVDRTAVSKTNPADGNAVRRPADSLTGLFRQLAELGHGALALEAVVAFARHHRIWKGKSYEELQKKWRPNRETTFQTFLHLVRRTLLRGLGPSMMEKTQWAPGLIETVRPTAKSATAGSAKFRPTLGMLMEPRFLENFKDGWYWSRKLDGVRCITFVDVRVDADLTIENVAFMSRAGNQFTSLAKLREELGALASLPKLREWLQSDSHIVSGHPDPTLRRLVLDGEVCVVEGDVRGTAFKENFAAAVSAIKRKQDVMENPTYFLFDVIPYCEFMSGCNKPEIRETFGQRHEKVKYIANTLGSDRVVALPQERMGLADVDEVVQRSMYEGWEGVIYRADTHYKPGRTKDILKFKEMNDAEYTVESITTSRQRMVVDGVHGEYEALASVVIRHHDHPVFVGSGFTKEQRLSYAKDPSLIVGKQITVAYFAESTAQGRDARSLRFPVVKHVWEEGKRSI